PFQKLWVGVFLVTCFFLIWNNYSNTFKMAMPLRWIGIAGLALFALFFPGGPAALKPYWWGILGLIGWSYLWAALVCVWADGRWVRLAGATLFFLVFCILAFGGQLVSIEPLKKYVWLVDNGALPFLCMLGVL